MKGSAIVTDPVCGMELRTFEAAATRDIGERTWFFCSDGCAHEFDRDPRKYLNAPPPEPDSPARR